MKTLWKILKYEWYMNRIFSMLDKELVLAKDMTREEFMEKYEKMKRGGRK